MEFKIRHMTGLKKSLRFDAMNYSYEIEDKSLGFLIVREIVNHGNSRTFSFNQLKNDEKFLISNYEYVQSFKRAKIWVLQNHPELLL